MPKIDDRVRCVKRGFSKPVIVLFAGLSIVALLIVVLVVGRTRGPSEDEVNGWLATLPAGATSDQVKSLFSSKEIFLEGELPSQGGLTCICGLIRCAGGRTIYVHVFLDQAGRMQTAHASESYMGP